MRVVKYINGVVEYGSDGILWTDEENNAAMYFSPLSPTHFHQILFQKGKIVGRLVKSYRSIYEEINVVTPDKDDPMPEIIENLKSMKYEK